MSTHAELMEVIYKTARASAQRVARIQRNLISADDLYQHSIVWALEHWHKIEEWNDQDSLAFKLRKTFINEGQRLCSRERVRRSRSHESDSFYYTSEILHQLLRDVWNYEGWLDTPDMSSEFVSKSTKPSEGNNRLALFADLTQAIASLNSVDRALLRQRYADGGIEFDALAVMYEVSEDAMRKRVKRAIVKLQDRLGGEAPMWSGRRKSKSNAQARAELREAEGSV
jgi:RNA polymerase sigma factor (sigma-70 family)